MSHEQHASILTCPPSDRQNGLFSQTALELYAQPSDPVFHAAAPQLDLVIDEAFQFSNSLGFARALRRASLGAWSI